MSNSGTVSQRSVFPRTLGTSAVRSPLPTPQNNLVLCVPHLSCWFNA